MYPQFGESASFNNNVGVVEGKGSTQNASDTLHKQLAEGWYVDGTHRRFHRTPRQRYYVDIMDRFRVFMMALIHSAQVKTTTTWRLPHEGSRGFI